ncbi:MAG: hypothetical protein ACKO9H_20340 [Planctomycetota bacterium]
MQTILTSLLILAAGAYCLRRATRALAGKATCCGKCQSCPAAVTSGSPSAHQPSLVQLGSLDASPRAKS